MCQDVVLLVVWRSVVAYGVVGFAYGLSDNICCSVHTLLRTFLCLSILVRLRLPRLGQPAEISIQRWTFCKDIVLLVIGEKANANGVMGYADRKGIVV